MKKFKYLMIYGALKTVALLPLWVLYGVSDFLRFVAHRLIGYRVKMVRKNLRNSFPDYDEKKLREIEKGFYKFLGDCIVETVKLLHISNRQLMRRARLTNPEFVEQQAALGQPIFLFLGHYCNWEWVPVTTLWVDKPEIMGSLYRPLQNRVMDRVMLRLRTRLNLTCIPVLKAYRTLLEMKREGKEFMIGFIADQRPAKPHIHWTEFLNQRTAFATGAETIGHKIGARYLFLDMQRVKRGYYTLTYKEMDITPFEGQDYPYTRCFFSMLEKNIRKAPQYWLWSHNRWKQ